MVNQAGLFTITPSGKDNLVSTILNELAENEVINPDDPNDVARYISKVHVPNDNRLECLNALRKMNIHHANLFPDPGGASRFCNDWLSRVVEDERADLEAKRRAVERERQRKIDPKSLAVKSGDVDENLAQLLRTALTGKSLVKIADLRKWAPKLRMIYEGEAALDWPDHPSTTAQLNIAFRRFLLSNGLSREMAEFCAWHLIEFFKARWRAANAS